ncbi:MAG: sulfotransferase [Chromatiales bacterium]
MLFRRKYPLHLNEKVSPIFIIGSGRSGNTILRRVLTNSSELYIPPETYVLGQAIRQFHSSRCLDWNEMCLLTLGTFSNSQDFDTFPTPYLLELYESLVKLPEAERSLSKIVDGFYGLMLQKAKPAAKRWGDKTPLNSYSLYGINKLFPDARYVHIIRNGYDVINSYLNMGRYSEPESAARRWVKAVNDCHHFKTKHPARVIEIKYEDFCYDPELTTRNLCSFLNLEYITEMVNGSEYRDALGDIETRAHYSNVSKPIDTSSIGKGILELDDNIIEIVNPIISRTLSKFGYI